MTDPDSSRSEAARRAEIESWCRAILDSCYTTDPAQPMISFSYEHVLDTMIRNMERFIATAIAQARAEERERLLDLAAVCEAEITSESKHLSGEKAGAHMLGALIRKRAVTSTRGLTEQEARKVVNADVWTNAADAGGEGARG